MIAIYAERLARRGHDVLVVYPPQRKPTPKDRLSSLVKGEGWRPYEAVGPSHFDGIDVPQKMLETWRPIVDADVPDADVMVAAWCDLAHWAGNLRESAGAKVHFIQGFETLGGNHVRQRVETAWRLPMHKIVISSWLVSLASKSFGDSDVSLVRNSVDTDLFWAPSRSKQEKPTVGILYSTSVYKRLGHTLEAIRIVEEAMGSIQVVSYGLDDPTKDLPLPADCHFERAPQQDRIRELYAKCDVWLCGSVREGFHLPPLEAMACRCPVVSTRVGGPLDIVRDGENGFVVDVDDVQGLADRVVQVLQLPEADWKRMSDAALATATGYTWEDATELFERALERAVEKHQQGLC